MRRKKKVKCSICGVRRVERNMAPLPAEAKAAFSFYNDQDRFCVSCVDYFKRRAAEEVTDGKASS